MLLFVHDVNSSVFVLLLLLLQFVVLIQYVLESFSLVKDSQVSARNSFHRGREDFHLVMAQSVDAVDHLVVVDASAVVVGTRQETFHASSPRF